jgi:hypothetical protein
MNKSDLPFMPEFFDRYINLAEDEEINFSLENSLHELENIDRQELESLEGMVYAPNKWTINDILQHLIDNERIQVYRALRFARNDRNQLQGYDQNLFANNTAAKKRTIADLIDELILVRMGTIHLFKSFTNWMLKATGRANGIELTVLAIGFTLVGHQKHHFNIIKERYMPLLTQSS